jgi:hypothetical protein
MEADSHGSREVTDGCGLTARVDWDHADSLAVPEEDLGDRIAAHCAFPSQVGKLQSAASVHPETLWHLLPAIDSAASSHPTDGVFCIATSRMASINCSFSMCRAVVNAS